MMLLTTRGWQQCGGRSREGLRPLSFLEENLNEWTAEYR